VIARGAMLRALYRAASELAPPVLRVVLARRRARGKEDAARLGERRGRASLPRPTGRLAWIHGASVGEARSVLPLIERLLAADAELHVLVTTGTVTSARLLSGRLPPRALHQFVPLDAAPWVRAFLDHWRPDLALWVESELWPSLLGEAARRGVPLALVNARMSDRSYRGWRRWPAFAASLVGAFDLVLAQSAADAERYRRLGARAVSMPGNLKFAAPPLPVDEAALRAFRSEAGGRPSWVAASIHPGEDAIVSDAHRLLKREAPRVLSIVVPRHPEKGAAMQRALATRGFAVSRRAAGDSAAACDIYLADTLGELGLFYRAARAAFIGGSLVPHGGQNPIEPALLGCPILHGPHMHNFAAVIAGFDAAGGAEPVADAGSLAAAVAALLGDPARHQAMAEAARRAAEAEQGALDRIMAQLHPLLVGGPASARAQHAPA
jgi:3-deoxy-D-manno-octulosonic-acid transferase